MSNLLLTDLSQGEPLLCTVSESWSDSWNCHYSEMSNAVLFPVSLAVRVLLFLLLVVAGDVERNPGPRGENNVLLSTCTC